jgi:hypothetical protein
VNLVPHDLSWCVRRLADPVRELLQKNPGSVFLAGGYIRACIAREPIADVDLFVSATTDVKSKVRELVGTSEPGDLISYTENAATIHWKPRVQIIHRWTFESATDGIERFDFTIARAAIWFDGSSWQSVCDESYYSDLAAKRIVYCAPKRDEEPGGSLLRLLKFYRRGIHGAARHHRSDPRAHRAQRRRHRRRRMAGEFTRLLREVDPEVAARSAKLPECARLSPLRRWTTKTRRSNSDGRRLDQDAKRSRRGPGRDPHGRDARARRVRCRRPPSRLLVVDRSAVSRRSRYRRDSFVA